MAVETSVSQYLAVIGRNGGKKSRRQLSSEQARDMVRVRELRRAFREFYARCFWYMRPDAHLTLDDLPEVVRGLRKNGGKDGILRAVKLCRQETVAGIRPERGPPARGSVI